MLVVGIIFCTRDLLKTCTLCTVTAGPLVVLLKKTTTTQLIAVRISLDIIFCRAKTLLPHYAVMMLYEKLKVHYALLISHTTS